MTHLFRMRFLACLLLASFYFAQTLTAATVPDPVIEPNAGTYNHPVLVWIAPTCDRADPRTWAGARIHLTIDGTEPTDKSPEYVLPFIIADSTLVRARAFCVGLNPSREVRRNYVLTFSRVAARPVFTPAPGTFAQAQQVTLSSSTPGVTIRYTTNGAIPTLWSSLYSGPITVQTNTVLRARAWKKGLWPSGVSIGEYRFQTGSVTLTPGTGTYTTEPLVTMQATTPDAVIRYTTDGSAVSATSPIYGGPLTIFTSTMVHATAFRAGVPSSAEATATYSLAVAPIVVNPASGMYPDPITVTATSSTNLVTVRMTQDGSEPTESSPLFSAPLTVNTDTTLLLKGFRLGWTPSATTTVAYTFPQDTAIPMIAPATGIYNVEQTVALSTTTSGAQIYFTVDGSEPTSASTLYQDPFSLSHSAVIKAMAVRSGWHPSAVITSAITLQVAPVALAPGTGTFISEPLVTMQTITGNAVIRYTTDGSLVNATSPIYGGPLTVSASATVRAAAFRPGFLPSDETTSTYSLAVAPIVVNLPAGFYPDPISITALSSTNNVTIRMTLDGSEPTEASPELSSPLPLASNTTLSLKGFRLGWAPSATTTTAYTFPQDTAAPVIAPATGTYDVDQTVVLSTTTSGAQIYFTLDGSEPTSASTLYQAPFALSISAVIKAMAVGLGRHPSASVVSTITLQVPAPSLTKNTGTYFDAFTVQTLGVAAGTLVRYTQDGIDPIDSSLVFPESLSVDRQQTLIIRAFREGWSPSASVSAIYTMQVAPLTMTPASPQTTVGLLDVTVVSTTPNVLYRFTTNGSDPLGEASVSNGIIMLDKSANLSVIGVRPGFLPSELVTGSYTITPTVSIPQRITYANENVPDAKIAISLSAATDHEVTIPFARVIQPASTNAATLGEDFVLVDGVVTIPAGSTTGFIPVSIIDDAIQEIPEIVVVQLQTPNGAALAGDGMATLVIVDDEPQPTVSFGAAGSVVSETAGGIDIPVVLSAASQIPVTVRVQVDGGTATFGTDYQIANPVVTFAPRQTTALLHIDVIDDQAAEAAETALIRLTSQTDAGLGTQRTHTLTITSNERPLVCLDWNLTARQIVATTNTDPVMASRVYALLSIAQDRAARAVGDDERSVAVATASCELLSLLFPSQRTQLQAQLVNQKASASWPGSSTDDVTGTDTTGRRIARAVQQEASSDGADTRWAGVVPVGAGYWYSSWTYAKPPLRPTWGQVRPWLMTSGSQFRPGPPPTFGSSAFQTALSEVRTIADNRTEEQLTIAGKWADGPGTQTPTGHWNEIASALIAAHNLDESQAVHLLSVLNAAQMDAGIATWDSKYTYWLIRPYQADLAISTPVGQPNFPSCTSGHAGFSGAASTVLESFFPDSAATVRAQAEEAAMSRLYGGIHYRFDNDNGLILGRSIGALALQKDADGSWRGDSQPKIVITSPKPGALISGGQQPSFTGLIRLQTPAQNLVSVQAVLSNQTTQTSPVMTIAPTVNALEWSFTVVPGTILPDGIHTLRLQVTDNLGGMGTGSVTVGIDSDGPPVIVISAPVDHVLLGRSGTTTITGTVSQSLARLTINGTPISFTVNGNGVSFAQAMTVEPTLQAVRPLTLVSGQNDVEVMAIDQAGLISVAMIHVDVDAESPAVRIESPSGKTTRESVTVTGSINDVVLGTVNRTNATVTVNGIAAQVVNRTFLVENVPLVPGSNQLIAIATDAAGNQSTHHITVTRAAPLGAVITLVSGDRQQAPVETRLPQPILVKVASQTGQPLRNQVVKFQVTRGDGSLTDADDELGQSRSVLSDANGFASVQWSVGSRVGLGNQRLTVSVLGSPNTVEISADTTPGPPAHLSVIYGDQQTGAVGALLPYFLRVRIADIHGNPIQGDQISFTVTRGTSSLSATQALSTAVTHLSLASDSDGFGTIWLTLGAETDPEEHLIEVTANGYTGRPITMRATARIAGPIEATSLAGRVLSGEGKPIGGATVVIDGTTIGAVSDQQGYFHIHGVPPGERHVTLNGTTATTTTTRYPTIGFEFTFVSGIVNTMPRPFYLPEMDISGQQWVGGDEDVILSMPGNPEYKVKVFAHSTIRADGVRAPVRMFLNQVNALAVPMAPQGGAGPVTVSTLQPSGTRLDPPAQIICPNLFARFPGAQYDLKVFDHDLGEFVSYGLGTVDADGATITTDAGVGYGKAGWGFFDVPLPLGDVKGEVPYCNVTSVTGETKPRLFYEYTYTAQLDTNMNNPWITWQIINGGNNRSKIISGQGSRSIKVSFDELADDDVITIVAISSGKDGISSRQLSAEIIPPDIKPSRFVAGSKVKVRISPVPIKEFSAIGVNYVNMYTAETQKDVTCPVTKHAVAGSLNDDTLFMKSFIIVKQEYTEKELTLWLNVGNELSVGDYDIDLMIEGVHRIKKALKVFKPDMEPAPMSFAECLRKRTGMVDDPVIIMESGGDRSVSGCSLVGFDDGQNNTWTLSLKADLYGSRVPGSYSWVWDTDGGEVTSGSAGNGESGGTSSITVTYHVGRHNPSVRIYRTVSVGNSMQTSLVSSAAIHSIHVYGWDDDGAGWPSIPLAEENQYGSRCTVVRNEDEGTNPPVNVQIALDAKAHNDTRARFSPDGYPQNEYWVTKLDLGDLPQPYVFKWNNVKKTWVQGYGAASTTTKDLSVIVRKSKRFESDTTEATFSTLSLDVAFDRNRDGAIDFSTERTSPLRPFRFWVNADEDKGDEGSNQDLPNEQLSYDVNGQDSRTNGRRDLVDWVAIGVKMNKVFALIGNIDGVDIVIKQADQGVNILYSNIPTDQVGSIQVKPLETGFGTSLTEAPFNASVDKLTFSDITVPSSVRSQSFASLPGGATFYIEGARETTKPLIVLARLNGQIIARDQCHLSISSIERMYRWMNLRGAVGRPVSRPTDVSEPTNWPDVDTNGKQVVLVHGFNVDEPGAREWGSEFFKRMYHSGSNAMITGVAWGGDERKWPSAVLYELGAPTPADYHLAEERAFVTASHLRVNVETLPGNKVMVSHSLGAGVVGSAIVDNGFRSYTKFIMVDAAMPLEAYQPYVPPVAGAFDSYEPLMINPQWKNYEGTQNFPQRLWPSSWWRLFPQSDLRSKLTWRGRFDASKLPNTMNMFSSGEEVLQNSNGVFPGPTARRAWPNNEFSKGIGPALFQLITSEYPADAGWGLDLDDVHRYVPLGSMDPLEKANEPLWIELTNLQPTDEVGFAAWYQKARQFILFRQDIAPSFDSLHAYWLALNNDTMLRQHPFFRWFNNRQLLTDDYQLSVPERNYLLAHAIPAQTFASGSNLNPSFDEELENFDMEGHKTNGWPETRLRGTAEQAGWFHSDLKDVAYYYTFEAYREIVRQGGLKP